MTVASNLENINENIRAACARSARNLEEIQIIAVTKYVSPETAQAAVDAGIKHIGENRDSGLLDKRKQLKGDINWHFIGSLQSKKVKNMIHDVDYIHSLDRLSLAEEINKRTEKIVNCFVQVNVSGEESKHGLTPEEVIPFIRDLEQYEKIKVVGLMTMAPFTNEEAILRNCFRKLKELSLSVQALELDYAPCRELSMGMSNDYTIAIEEGATFIRIGTSLVGNEFGG